MSYRVLIVDNDNGETIIDTNEAVAIVGSIADKTGAHGLGCTDCGMLELFATLTIAKKAIRDVEKDVPSVKDFANTVNSLTIIEE